MVFNIFTTRETAIGIFILIVIVYCLVSSKIRKSLLNVLAVAFNWKFFVLYLSIIIYTAVAIYGLCLIGLWNIGMLKDTIIWVLFTGINLCFKAVDNMNKKLFFTNTLKSTFLFTIIIEFITSTYTFSLWIEIVTIFLIIFIGCLKVVAESDRNTKSIIGALNILVIVYGIICIIYSVIKATIDYQNFISVNTFLSFILPIILMLIFIPFIYILSMQILYEDIFIRVKSSVRKNKKLYRYLKLKTRKTFFLRLFKLEKFRQSPMFSNELFRTREEIDNFFTNLKKN